MPRAKHRRKGKTRPRGTPPWFRPESEADVDDRPRAEDLLDWQPRVRHEPDPRQGQLDLTAPDEGREAEARLGFTPWW
jgi:hypothetical protein